MHEGEVWGYNQTTVHYNGDSKTKGASNLDHPSPSHRGILQYAQAELKKYLHFKEEFWKRKKRM